MPLEKSAGAVIFRKAEGKIFYLLLHCPSISHRAPKQYWDLPKGHIEKGEEEIETIKREIKEETGLENVEFIEGFKERIKYFFNFRGKNILKFVTFYLAETKTEDIEISGEHIGYKWLPYEEALEQLTFQNAKKNIQKANDFLSEKGLCGGK